MKRLIAAAALVAVAVSITAGTGYIFGREMDFFEKSLNNLISESEKLTEDELAAKAEILVAQWDESLPILRCVVLHEGVDELGRNISSLPKIIRHSGRDEMKIKCIEAINLIKNLKACEKLTFENVL